MSSQQSRTGGPYSLSTPASGRINLMSSSLSANRASSLAARSARGSTARNDLDDLSGNLEDSGSSEQILAAIATLSEKIDLEFANISEKFEEEIASMSNQCVEHYNTLNNKLARVTDKLYEVEDHLVQPLAQGTQATASASGPAAPQLTPPKPWSYSVELKDRVYVVAYQSVTTPNIEAYTKRESPDGDLLTGSLFNTIRQEILNMPAPFAEQQLPPLNNGVADVAAVRAYHKLIKNAGKHARERMHHLVLHNVRNPREPNIPQAGTVPTMKRLLHRIANHCGELSDNRDVETLWNQTDWSHRLRIAYLVTMRIFQAVRRGKGRPDIWARVDKQLHKLRVEGPLYTTAFYRLVYNEDVARFNGEGHITDLDPLVTFDLPSEDAIAAEIEALQAEGIGAENE
ncbi:hypothetical protein DFH28DRAFT_1183999 [Melampsora americana]|nr:hypothetical protein DFH28DRAFT_1183999 [Melampsora americana]